MEIRSKRELRIAYENLLFYKIVEAECRDNQRALQTARDHILRIKKDIRAYYHEQDADEGYTIYPEKYWDSYIKVDVFPEGWTKDDAEEWFYENEFIRRPGGQYDCTGKRFTSWHSIVKRAGRLYLYHCIALDV